MHELEDKRLQLDYSLCISYVFSSVSTKVSLAYTKDH